MSCPISWKPGALTPVFHGVRDLTIGDGAPCALRVFFPTLDGAEFDAAILRGCGRYPLILFVHGHCEGDLDEHYKKWFHLPGQLARSGYVVVVPQRSAAGTHPSVEDHPDIVLMSRVVDWIRKNWESSDVLPPSLSGICGHSFGALLAARLVDILGCSAYASLSGTHEDWPSPPLPIQSLRVPKLFIMGNGAEDISTSIDAVWNMLSIPRHRARFLHGFHWDYLQKGETPCDSERGPCNQIPGAAADLITTFFAKYLPPEQLPNLPNQIPDTLIPPLLKLTQEQKFFAAGHLVGFKQLAGKPKCEVELDRMTSNDRVVPHVRFMPVSAARAAILQLELKVHVKGPQENAFVLTQSPGDGEIVPVGTTIKLVSQAGDTP